jgi:hypothetical protein
LTRQWEQGSTQVPEPFLEVVAEWQRGKLPPLPRRGSTRKQRERARFRV